MRRLVTGMLRMLLYDTCPEILSGRIRLVWRALNKPAKPRSTSAVHRAVQSGTTENKRGFNYRVGQAG